MSRWESWSTIVAGTFFHQTMLPGLKWEPATALLTMAPPQGSIAADCWPRKSDRTREATFIHPSSLNDGSEHTGEMNAVLYAINKDRGERHRVPTLAVATV